MVKTPENVPDNNVGRKTPEEIKKGLEICSVGNMRECMQCPYPIGFECFEQPMKDALAYIQQLEACRWELFDDLSTAYYGKTMYGLNDDGTVYSRYSCDTMPFERAVDEFRRLIADE